MTAIPLPAASTAPLPVLPLEPLGLSYAKQEKPELPPLVRAGRTVGLVGLLLATIMLGVQDYHRSIPVRIETFLHLLLPSLQLMSVGCGMTLIVLGRRFAGCRLGPGFRMAITLHFVTMMLAVSELTRQV